MAPRTLLFFLLLLGYPTPPALAFELITAEEASRPDDDYDDLRASPFPAAEIEVFGLQEKMTSPLDFVIEIRPFAGTTVKMNSLQIIYQKLPKENLLSRIRDFVEMQDKTVVIHIRNAEVPIGRHQILILAEDARGRTTEKPLTFRVCAKADCP